MKRGEGKTTIANTLALHLMSLGYKVCYLGEARHWYGDASSNEMDIRGRFCSQDKVVFIFDSFYFSRKPNEFQEFLRECSLIFNGKFIYFI